MSTSTDPVLEALWKRVVDEWESEERHAAFLDYCQGNERLVEAAVRYRGMTGDRARSESAEKKLRAVALLAMTKLEVSRTAERAGSGHTASYVLIVVFVLASIGLLAYLTGTR